MRAERQSAGVGHRGQSALELTHTTTNTYTKHNNKPEPDNMTDPTATPASEQRERARPTSDSEAAGNKPGWGQNRGVGV